MSQDSTAATKPNIVFIYADAAAQASALKHAENALAHWKQYAAIYDRQYTPQLLNRVGLADIPALTVKAAEDI